MRLNLASVGFGYHGRPALSEIVFEAAGGELIALVGPNGAGKSSLLRAAMGLEALAEGEILFRDRPLAGIDTPDRARLGIGYCPEGRRLFPGMSVLDTLHAAMAASRAAIGRAHG